MTYTETMMTKMKKIVPALAIILGLGVAATPLHAAKSETVKVVYQCDFPDVERVHLMLNTLTNVLEYYQSKAIDFDIHVVALGPCLQYFMKDYQGTGFEEKPYITHGGPLGNGTRARFNALKLQGDDGITFHACQNTMKKKNVKEDQLMENVKTTPAGIIKIIDLEQSGYAYIKIQ